MNDSLFDLLIIFPVFKLKKTPLKESLIKNTSLNQNFFYKSYTSLSLILLLLINICLKFTLVAECGNDNVSNNERNIQILIDQYINNAREEELPEINNFLRVLVENGAVERPVFTPEPAPRFGWESFILFTTASVLSFVFIRYGSDIWHFMRSLTGEIVETIINLPQITRDSLLNMARQAVQNPANHERISNWLQERANRNSAA